MCVCGVGACVVCTCGMGMRTCECFFSLHSMTILITFSKRDDEQLQTTPISPHVSSQEECNPMQAATQATPTHYTINEVLPTDSDIVMGTSTHLPITIAELISPNEKEMIITFAEYHSISQASQRFKVPTAMIKRWIRDRDDGAQMKPKFNSPGQGRKLSYSVEKDEAIAFHIREKLSQGEKVTMQYLCQYAKNFIQEELPQFNASSGWAQRFLIRHAIDIGRPKYTQNAKLPESRGRPLSYSTETDQLLADYVRSRISEGQVFTNSELRKYAKEVVMKENSNFTGSASWAQNFLHRHKISLQSIVHESTEPSSHLAHPQTSTTITSSLSDNSIGPAAEITPTTSHPGMYSDMSSASLDSSTDDTMKTALAILAGESHHSTMLSSAQAAALQSSLSEMTSDSVSLVDLLTSTQQLQDASDDGGVSLIASGLESPSGSIYLSLGGSESFGSGFTTQVDPNTQAPIPISQDSNTKLLPQQFHDVVAQASRPLSYTKETDQQLAKWVQDQQAVGKKVTFAMLRTFARKLISQENPNFNASVGWVTPFLLRHNLDLNLNKKKARKGSTPRKVHSDDSKCDSPIDEEDEGETQELSLQTAGPPILTSDVLATVIATSLAEQSPSSLPSLAEQAQIVLTQQSQLCSQTERDLTSITNSSPKPTSGKNTPLSESHEKSRNRHTLAEKLEVVRLMKKYNVAAHYVCRTLGIANSTFAGWTKLVTQKGPELEALSANRKRANVKGQGRPLSYSKETDESIAQWVRAQQQLGMQVTPGELGKYATDRISRESSHFTASSGWQQKFLQRHNLQLHSAWSQKVTTPTPGEDKQLPAVVEDQTNIPTPVQTEEVVSNEFKPEVCEWPFGSDIDSELAKWIKEQVQQFGNFSVSGVCKKAEEVSQNQLFVATLGWAFKFLHKHGIMLDPKPTISQLCATALNRKRHSESSPPEQCTPKKLHSIDSQEVSVSPSTGNLCEALLALSNHSATEGGETTTMHAALQSLHTAVAQVIQQQQQQLQVDDQQFNDEPLALEDTPPSLKEARSDDKSTPNSQSSNTYFGKPAREFSSDEKEEVVRYANATTLQKAALKYRVAAPTVWRWRVELKLHQPKYTPMQKKYIIKFAEANSLREASTRYGISGKTIQNWRKSLLADGELTTLGLEEASVVSMAAGGPEPMESCSLPQKSNESSVPEVVTYDTPNFQFIVDGGEVVESGGRTDLASTAQPIDQMEPLPLEVTTEVDIENVGMEYDIVSSEGHAAKPRCTVEEKEHILHFALDHSVREASNKYGISQGTLYYWKKNMLASGNGSVDLNTTSAATPTGAGISSHLSSLAAVGDSPDILQGLNRTTPIRRDPQTLPSHYSALSAEALQNLPTDVNFLHAVSSLLSSGESDRADKSRMGSGRLHSTSGGISSPTEVLVTPFHSNSVDSVAQSEIDSTATVTVVTSGSSVNTPPQPVDLTADEQVLAEGPVQIEDQVVEVMEEDQTATSAQAELSMPSAGKDGLESVDVEEVELSMPSASKYDLKSVDVEEVELNMPNVDKDGLSPVSVGEVDISQMVELVDSAVQDSSQ